MKFMTTLILLMKVPNEGHDYSNPHFLSMKNLSKLPQFSCHDDTMTFQVIERSNLGHIKLPLCYNCYSYVQNVISI